MITKKTKTTKPKTAPRRAGGRPNMRRRFKVGDMAVAKGTDGKTLLKVFHVERAKAGEPRKIHVHPITAQLGEGKAVVVLEKNLRRPSHDERLAAQHALYERMAGLRVNDALNSGTAIIARQRQGLETHIVKVAGIHSKVDVKLTKAGVDKIVGYLPAHSRVFQTSIEAQDFAASHGLRAFKIEGMELWYVPMPVPREQIEGMDPWYIHNTGAAGTRGQGDNTLNPKPALPFDRSKMATIAVDEKIRGTELVDDLLPWEAPIGKRTARITFDRANARDAVAFLKAIERSMAIVGCILFVAYLVGLLWWWLA